MKRMIQVAAAFAAFMAGSATAEPQAIFHTSPLPCVPMPDGGMFCGSSDDVKYRPEDGDQVLVRFHGFYGLEYRGLPPFVREVQTTDGRLWRGTPRPSSYVVEAWRDDKHIPTLDVHIRFIPR